MQQPNVIMIATCRNLATDRVFEETERSLFLRKEDPDSRIEAYVAVDPTISSDWHELSPVVDLSDADSVQFEALLEKKPFKLATDASGSVSSASKVALQSLDALRLCAVRLIGILRSAVQGDIHSPGVSRLHRIFWQTTVRGRIRATAFHFRSIKLVQSTLR